MVKVLTRSWLRRLRISRRGVRVTLQNFSSRYTVLDKPRSGRPPNLSQRDKRKFVIESKRNPFDTARVVRSKCGFSNTVCLSTIRNVLRRGGQMGRIAVRKPFLTRVHKNRWLQFCQTKLNFTSVDWSKYIFTDECKVTTDGAKRAYVRCSKNSAMKPTHVKSTKKFPPSIMVWGAIRSDGRRVLIRTNFTIDSREYQRVLEEACILFTIIALLCSKMEQGVTHLGLQWRTFKKNC